MGIFTFELMTIHEASQRLLFSLYHIYDQQEAANIADWVMENLTGWKKIDRMLNKHVKFSAEMETLLEKYITELSAHKPVQYVLHEAWFCGLKLYVNENVLIPRPETEELVEWIASDNKNAIIKILDIGTGSGCIAIALKKKLPNATVYACDISEEALAVAKKNAELNNAEINFLLIDILNTDKIPEVNIVVSNPPYIPVSEKTQMNKNVTEYEPHLALFVEDNNPLIFYTAIKNINASTYYFETHENLAADVAALFQHAEIKQDMQGKNRMVIARQPYPPSTQF
jgi:release factor glutamine methyltransferase